MSTEKSTRALCHCMLHIQQKLDSNNRLRSSVTGILKYVFCHVVNCESQIPMWAINTTVRQRRGISLNVSFLWNIPRSKSQIPESILRDFLFCSKGPTTKNNHLMPPSTRLHWNCSRSTNETNLNLTQRAFLVKKCCFEVVSPVRLMPGFYEEVYINHSD
jgi:hypothetical protein